MVMYFSSTLMPDCRALLACDDCIAVGELGKGKRFADMRLLLGYRGDAGQHCTAALIGHRL
jgi:hypothetical protein